MKYYGIYRCKQCGAICNAENELGGFVKESLMWSFTKDNPIISISPFRGSDKAIAHRCDDSTFGLCELIGWRKQVE